MTWQGAVACCIVLGVTYAVIFYVWRKDLKQKKENSQHE